MAPSVVSAVKFGATSLIRSDMTSSLLAFNTYHVRGPSSVSCRVATCHCSSGWDAYIRAMVAHAVPVNELN